MKKEKKQYDYFGLYISRKEDLGVACSPKSYNGGNLEKRNTDGYRFLSIRDVQYFKGTDEIPCIFELEDGILGDYLCNDMGYPLFSAKLRNIVETHIQNVLPTRWLNVKVKDTNGEIVIYYMPLYENFIDTVDYEISSRLDNGEIIYPTYSLKKIKDLDFFPSHEDPDEFAPHETKYAHRIDNDFIISKKFKKILLENKITGICFERARVNNDLNPELEKQWDEVISYWTGRYKTWADYCNFLFNVDRYYIAIMMLTLPKIKKAAISEQVKPYEDVKRLETDEEIAKAKFLNTPGMTKTTLEDVKNMQPYAKQHITDNEYFKDKQQAMHTGIEIVYELSEEEFIKNNLRRLFEYYDDTTYTYTYRNGEIRTAYGAVGIPAAEVLEVLAGKTPVKDEQGIVRFLGLPTPMQKHSEELQEAALKTKDIVEKAVVTREICSPEYIFKHFRKLKNKFVDKDKRRKHGTELEQQHQIVKDYAREIIEDAERTSCYKKEDGDVCIDLFVREADLRWTGVKHEDLDILREAYDIYGQSMHPYDEPKCTPQTIGYDQ